uniref:Uncharacterized protein n=1 Tax=Cucumis melo TaxID=3656 RepID=A0A9I9D9X2_CUCME
MLLHNSNIFSNPKLLTRTHQPPPNPTVNAPSQTCLTLLPDEPDPFPPSLRRPIASSVSFPLTNSFIIISPPFYKCGISNNKQYLIGTHRKWLNLPLEMEALHYSLPSGWASSISLTEWFWRR